MARIPPKALYGTATKSNQGHEIPKADSRNRGKLYLRGMSVSNPPDQYWHCLVKLTDHEEPAVVNDLRYTDVERMIVRPWLSGQPFTVAGSIVRPTLGVAQIKIVHTDQPQQTFSDRHYASLRGTGIVDFATDTRDFYHSSLDKT